MRNVDKVKELERELGIYRKKVADQEKQIKKLEDELEKAYGGGIELHSAMDAVLCQTVLTCGENVYDDDDQELVIGKNLKLPRYNADELLKQYVVKAELYQDRDEYVIGIMEREDGREE